MKRIKIFYGSVGGNTELVCERVAEVLQEEGHKPTLHKAKLAKPEDIAGADLYVFASPTYGHGQLEGYMEKFLFKCRGLDLKGAKFAVIGLGDDKYDADYFIESTRLIIGEVRPLGAQMVGIPLMIARSPLPYLNKEVAVWTRRLSSKLTD